MPDEILDGSGNGWRAKVDKNKQLHTYSISETSLQSATEKGNSFVVNTGAIALTSTSDSALFYIQNNEAPLSGESDLIIESIIIGIDDTATTVDQISEITFIKNPTTGTIISTATAVSISENRNFGSSVDLTDSLIYKGAEAATITDGTTFDIIYQPAGTNIEYPINIVLQRGSSFGVKLNTHTSVGTTNAYVAIVCYRKDGDNYN